MTGLVDGAMTEDPTPSVPDISSQSSASEPGRLTNSVRMTIQTRVAQRLIHGRRSDPTREIPAIAGLYRYAAMTRLLWFASLSDDPYADWWLLRIEQEVNSVREQLHDMRSDIGDLLNGAPSMDVSLAHSSEPASVELTFATPYAYQGAYLLADLDIFVLAAMTARFVGLLDRNTFEKRLADSGRGVRRLFATVQGYRHLTVTRNDVRQQTPKGRYAIELMGPLPEAVLNRSLRAAHAPALRISSEGPLAPESTHIETEFPGPSSKG